MGPRVSVSDFGEPWRLAGLRVSSGPKLPECCVLETALTNEAALATFDQTLVSAARRHGVVVNP
jgi:rRNA-processing protein FCF1